MGNWDLECNQCLEFRVSIRAITSYGLKKVLTSTAIMILGLFYLVLFRQAANQTYLKPTNIFSQGGIKVWISVIYDQFIGSGACRIVPLHELRLCCRLFTRYNTGLCFPCIVQKTTSYNSLRSSRKLTVINTASISSSFYGYLVIWSLGILVYSNFHLVATKLQLEQLIGFMVNWINAMSRAFHQFLFIYWTIGLPI